MMDNKPVNFYYNKYVLSVWILFLLLVIAFGIYLYTQCPIVGIVFLIPMFILLYFALYKFFYPFPYIIVKPSGIKYEDLNFNWDDIEEILFKKSYPKSAFPIIKIQDKNMYTEVSINLLSDKERKHLLDCISKYKKITYQHAEYDFNYMLWNICLCSFTVIFAMVALLYHEIYLK